MTDNLSQLKPLLNFDGGNYICLFTKTRQKDQPIAERFVSQQRDFYFGSLAELEADYAGLKAAADRANARIYISLNAQALSEEFKNILRKWGTLRGDKQLYGLAESTARYLLYDADKGCEEESARVLAVAAEAGVLIDCIPTVTGEGYIMRECDYEHIFGTRNHFYPHCNVLAYYNGGA